MTTRADYEANIKRNLLIAVNAGLEFVELLARGILKENPDLHEFVMSMGCWHFWDKEGNQLDMDDPSLKELWEFMNEYDEYLKLTGEPMRFTAEGPKKTDW